MTITPDITMSQRPDSSAAVIAPRSIGTNAGFTPSAVASWNAISTSKPTSSLLVLKNAYGTASV